MEYEYSWIEIASELGITVREVKNAYSSAMNKLNVSPSHLAEQFLD